MNKKRRQNSELLEYDPQRYSCVDKRQLTKTSLLSRKACVWQIFSSSAGTDGDTAHAILAHQGISIVNLLLDGRGKAGIHNHMSGLSTSISQVIQIRHVDVLEEKLESFPQFKAIEDGIVCSA